MDCELGPNGQVIFSDGRCFVWRQGAWLQVWPPSGASAAVCQEQPSIKCPKCGMVSYNPTDVRQKYCGNCHTFHEGLGRVRRPRLGDLWK